MPDFLKKAAKRTNQICDEDETPLAALFCRPRIGEETKRLGTPTGALSKVGKLADSATDADGNDESNPGGAGPTRSDDRDAMFGQNTILVLTPQRLLAFGHGTYTGRVKDLLGAVDLAEVAAIELEAPPVGESGASSLEISFVDGYRATLTPGTRRRRFVDAFDDVRQPA